MRRATLMLTLLLVAAWGWAQDAPPNPAPGGQTSSPSEMQGGRRHFHGVAGTITAIAADSLTVKTRDGKTVQVNLTDSTRYRKDRQDAKLADFKVGDEVFVRGQQSGDSAWQAEVVASGRPGGGDMARFREGLGKEFIVGEVKAINGTQLTIARPDGVSQTITVDETTSFRKDGESITLADLKAGDHVFGRGAIKNDVFVPAVLNVGEPRMMMRGRGQGQGQGQGQDQGPPPQ